MKRFVHIGLLCFAFLAHPVQAAEELPSAIMAEKHWEVFDTYCIDCHDADTEKGEINLEDLNFDIANNLQTAGTWQKVLNALNSSEMPPEKKKQLSAEEKPFSSMPSRTRS